MLKIFITGACLLLTAQLYAADPEIQKQIDSQEKTLSGMSIVGNDEAPKSLYIVPWKSSEIGVETSLDMLNNKDAIPIDREVFQRQLDFYQIVHQGN